MDVLSVDDEEEEPHQELAFPTVSLANQVVLPTQLCPPLSTPNQVSMDRSRLELPSTLKKEVQLGQPEITTSIDHMQPRSIKELCNPSLCPPSTPPPKSPDQSVCSAAPPDDTANHYSCRTTSFIFNGKISFLIQWTRRSLDEASLEDWEQLHTIFFSIISP